MRHHAPFGLRLALFLPLATAGLCVGLLGCTSQPRQAESPAAATSPPVGEPKRYDLKGKVVAVDSPGKKLTVDHEAIVDFMGAMTMAYPVKDEHLLENVKPGDQVTAKLVATGKDFWLEDVTVVGKTP